MFSYPILEPGQFPRRKLYIDQFGEKKNQKSTLKFGRFVWSSLFGIPASRPNDDRFNSSMCQGCWAPCIRVPLFINFQLFRVTSVRIHDEFVLQLLGIIFLEQLQHQIQMQRARKSWWTIFQSNRSWFSRHAYCRCSQNEEFATNRSNFKVDFGTFHELIKYLHSIRLLSKTDWPKEWTENDKYSSNLLQTKCSIPVAHLIIVVSNIKIQNLSTLKRNGMCSFCTTCYEN